MLVVQTRELIKAVRATNFLPNTPPGDPRQYRLFTVNDGKVHLTLYGLDDCWVQATIESDKIENVEGIKMLLSGLEKIEKLPEGTFSEIRTGDTGASLKTFERYSAKGKPVQIDKIPLNVYPGALDSFPEPVFATEVIESIPAAIFNHTVKTTLAVGEHVEKDRRPIRLTINPFAIISDSSSSRSFRFTLQTPGERYFHLRGFHLKMLESISSTGNTVTIAHLATEQFEQLTFTGANGRVTLPVQQTIQLVRAQEALNYNQLLNDTQTVSTRRVSLKRLDEALVIQNPSKENTSGLNLQESGNTLQLYKAGDIHQREVSNLPFEIQSDLSAWPLIRVDYYALLSMAKLARSLKRFHDVESDNLELQLLQYTRQIPAQRRRRQNSKAYLLRAVLPEHPGDYSIVCSTEASEPNDKVN